MSRLEGILECKRKKLHGRKRTQYILDAGGASAKLQEKKQRAATKRDANAAMERPVRGAIATVTVGAGDEAEVLTQPTEVAKECSEWGARHMSLMQPKWFRRIDVVVGHLVWVQRGGGVVGGTARAIDNDGHYTVTTHGGTAMVGVRLTDLCLKWQVGAVTSKTAAAAIRAELRVATPAGDDEADDAASIARSSGVTNDGGGDVAMGTTVVPSAEEVR